MARPRVPVDKLKAGGADVKNPQRMRGRAAPKGPAALGAPSQHLTLYQRRAFEKFRQEIPWLRESHRLLVEIGATLRGKILDPETLPELKELQELRRILGQLGATPADESKVQHGGEEKDPDDAFFGGAAGDGNRPH